MKRLYFILSLIFLSCAILSCGSNEIAAPKASVSPDETAQSALTGMTNEQSTPSSGGVLSTPVTEPTTASTTMSSAVEQSVGTTEPATDAATAENERVVVYKVDSSVLTATEKEYCVPELPETLEWNADALNMVETLKTQTVFGTNVLLSKRGYYKYYYNDYGTLEFDVCLPEGGQNANCGICFFSDDGQLLEITDRPSTKANCFILPKPDFSFETDDDETILRRAEESLADFADFSRFECKKVIRWPTHIVWSNQKDGVDLPGSIDVYFSGSWVTGISQTHFYDLPLDHDLRIDINCGNAVSEALKDAYAYYYGEQYGELKGFNVERADYTQYDGLPAIHVVMSFAAELRDTSPEEFFIQFCGKQSAAETFSGTVYIAEELPLNDAAENTATPGESITLFGKVYELRATQSSASNYDKNRWPRSAYKLLDQSTHNEKGWIEIGYDGQILSVSFTTSPVKIDRRVESTEGMIEQFKNALAELIDFSKLEGATVTDSNENGVRTIQWRKMKDGIELPGKVRASIGTDGSLTVVKTPDYDLPDLDILLDVEADNALTRAVSEKLTAYYGSNGVELIAVKGFRIPTQRDSCGCYTLYMGKPALFLMVAFSCETDRYTETEYLENVFVIFDV